MANNNPPEHLPHFGGMPPNSAHAYSRYVIEEWLKADVMRGTPLDSFAWQSLRAMYAFESLAGHMRARKQVVSEGFVPGPQPDTMVRQVVFAPVTGEDGALYVPSETTVENCEGLRSLKLPKLTEKDGLAFDGGLEFKLSSTRLIECLVMDEERQGFVPSGIIEEADELRDAFTRCNTETRTELTTPYHQDLDMFVEWLGEAQAALHLPSSGIQDITHKFEPQEVTLAN